MPFVSSRGGSFDILCNAGKVTETLWGHKQSDTTERLHFTVDSILKGRDIILSTNVCLVKVMVFPVVMYVCESWTIKKAERQRIGAFELWCWRKLLRVLGLQGDQISQS